MIDLAESARVSESHKRFWLPLAKAVAWVLLWILGGFRARGAYRVPSKGGVLILSNHRADIDPVAIQVGCPRMIHFMAKSELFDMGFLSRILRWAGSFPVKRGEPDRAPLKLAANLLKDGEVVAVFPEGELSESGELQALKSGVALIVRLAPEVPVICCGLKNTEKPMPYGKVVPRPAFTKMEVTWGEPRTFAKGAEVEEIIGWATGQLRELTS